MYDTLAEWELGRLMLELRTGRFTGTPWQVVTVAEDLRPVITMNGLRVVPDGVPAELDPSASGLLVPAGPQSSVQFAASTLGLLGLASERTLDAYDGVFHRADPAAYAELAQSVAA